MNSSRYVSLFFVQGLLRWATGLCALAVVLVLVGCVARGAASPTAVPASEPTATAALAPADTPTPAPAPADTATTAPASADTTPAPPAIIAELYDHAPDYSFIAGQLRQEGTCWIVAYVSLATAHAPDQYNNQMTLLTGGGWSPLDFKAGDWVIVQGQPEAGTDPALGCTAHGYEVSVMQVNPKGSTPLR